LRHRNTPSAIHPLQLIVAEAVEGENMTLEWMAWTLPTAIFFITIFCMLVGMTIWQMASPSIPRRGILPITTTRGDRLFIGLLGSAYIHLAWLGFTDLTIWIAFPLAIIWMIGVMRWG
jgi:predicted small integral membrane protein